MPVVKVLSNEASAGTVLNSEECQTYLTKLWGEAGKTQAPTTRVHQAEKLVLAFLNKKGVNLPPDHFRLTVGMNGFKAWIGLRAADDFIDDEDPDVQDFGLTCHCWHGVKE